MPYYANVFIPGTVKVGDLPPTVEVLESIDQLQPVGMAFGIGHDAADLVVWRLNVRGQDVPGDWHLIDGEFIPAE